MSNIKYCPICDKPCDLSDVACSRCQYDFNNKDFSKEKIEGMKKSYHRRKLNYEKSLLGTKWMNFYIYWRFPIGIFLGLTNILSAITKPGYFSNYWGLLGLSIDLSYFALVILTYIQMKKTSWIGYKFNFIVIACECLMFSLSRASTDNQAFGFWGSFFISGILFFLIWSLPNIVYFKKREHLFDSPIKGDGVINHKITFCRKCGTRLNTGSDYCRKCGLVISDKKEVSNL